MPPVARHGGRELDTAHRRGDSVRIADIVTIELAERDRTAEHFLRHRLHTVRIVRRDGRPPFGKFCGRGEALQPDLPCRIDLRDNGVFAIFVMEDLTAFSSPIRQFSRPIGIKAETRLRRIGTPMHGIDRIAGDGGRII